MSLVVTLVHLLTIATTGDMIGFLSMSLSKLSLLRLMESMTRIKVKESDHT